MHSILLVRQRLHAVCLSLFTQKGWPGTRNSAVSVSAELLAVCEIARCMCECCFLLSAMSSKRLPEPARAPSGRHISRTRPFILLKTGRTAAGGRAGGSHLSISAAAIPSCSNSSDMPWRRRSTEISPSAGPRTRAQCGGASQDFSRHWLMFPAMTCGQMSNEADSTPASGALTRMPRLLAARWARHGNAVTPCCRARPP